MNVAFIVENQDSKKFVLKDGLNFESVLCIYDTETHQIEWRSMKTIASDNLNMALSLFDMDVQRVVSTHLDDYLIQELNQNEITVYQAANNDLIDAIKRYNQHYLHEMDGRNMMVSRQHRHSMAFAEAF
jgi:sulfur relay (sulfurtransferase) DsrF/TusC family protein